MKFTIGSLLVLAVSLFLVHSNAAFAGIGEANNFAGNTRKYHNHFITDHSSSVVSTTSTVTRLFSGDGENNDDNVDDNDDTNNTNEPVTKDMFLREMLADPTVKRRKKGGSSARYRPLDNRDSLPFLVKDITPDPYTKPDVIKKQAKKNTQWYKEQSSAGGSSSSNNNSNGNGTMRKNLVGMEKGIAASIYNTMEDGSLDRILGQFQLDKSTTCGDILQVGEQEFQVVKAKCQYKYAGGKRFVMTRKVLEVKEITRIATERYLQKQFQKEE